VFYTYAPDYNQKANFIMAIRTGILCVPTHDDDASDRITQLLRATVPDLYVIENASAKNQLHWIEDLLCRWCDEDEIDLIVTIGGTFPAVGPTAAEIVPEATQNVIERLLPGLPEAMRAYAQSETPLALLDRGTAGIRGRSAILNLPTGAAPAYLFLEAVVDLIAPLMAYLDDEKPSPSMEDELILEDIEPDEQETKNFTVGNERAIKSPVEQNGKKKGLDPTEFAEYLARRGTSSSAMSENDEG